MGVKRIRVDSVKEKQKEKTRKQLQDGHGLHLLPEQDFQQQLPELTHG